MLHPSLNEYVSRFIDNIYGRLLSHNKKKSDNDSLLDTYQALESLMYSHLKLIVDEVATVIVIILISNVGETEAYRH